MFISSLAPCSFSKLLITNGMMMENTDYCGLIQHGDSYSSTENGYSINK